MKTHLSRTLMIPALLAFAIAPLALTAAADSHGKSQDKRWEHHHRYDPSRHEERRHALQERAGIDEETRQALEAARSEHHEAIKELHEAHRQQMDEILGEEQREALRQAHHDMHAEYRTERREEIQDRIDALIDNWDLSDEERKTVRETREAIYADIQALRDRDFASRGDRRDAMREMRREHQTTLEALLDESQLEELREAMRPGNRSGWKGHHGRGRMIDD